MAERENKQGVHGWRAALLMFGCGTLAALAAVGIIFGGFRMYFSGGTSNSNSSSPGGSAQQRDPITSMDEGALDLCTAVEEDFLSGESPRLDGSEPPDDSGEGKGRIVSDECEWNFTSNEYGQGNLKFSYRAFVTDGDGASREDQASSEFENRRKDMEEEFSVLENQGSAQNTLTDAYFYYGLEGSESIKYGVVGEVKSGVYSAVFVDVSPEKEVGPQHESRMRSDLSILDDVVFTEMDLILPD